ncbi:hypothetical protein RHMOL_Rhmol03G0036900 [Rhododendron molle]|uniref:Uncharacterized protein n=1 Tax=Rhododendron molle TaxID=49168 RepID=A0ACC0P9R8_RHOML|nr:hypothetical protein RHMOL_Rhmol03G0036900 [Rhododendron molle]
MAEAILTGAAANVLSSLGSYALQHIGLPCGVKRKLRKMENNISTIKNVLLDAQEQQMSNRAVKEWIERVKLILYDAEDLLDEVATETKRRQMETHNSLMRKSISQLSICSIVFAKLPSTSLVARENMAEAILTGAAANVLSSLGSYAIQQIGIPFGVEDELRKMETNISTIKDVLLDAEERQMSNRAVKGWLERLKLILYDAEDLLDEFATDTKRRQVETHNSFKRKVHYFFTSSNPLVSRYEVGRKIRDIGRRLDEIVLQMHAFKFVVKHVERPNQINRREETSSFVNTVSVIGRDADKEKLVRLLLSSGDEENVAIIPIVGMGGLGKTTLAQLVYNHDRIKEHFTKRLWVCISNDFDIKRVLIKLLQADDSNRDTSYSNEGLEQLQNRVKNMLREDKFILFLDDIWNEDLVEWKKLEDLLITQARGSRIVVTTRSKKVASIVRTSTVEPYELRGLSNNECLDILVKWAFKEGDESKHPNLVNIGKKIVEKCGGVPLAARTLGAFLFSKTNERDWLFVRDNEMWAIVQKENDILPILRLSYDQMPSYLKHCFAYCSLFEKDEIIYGTKLIYAWMALGFVQCVDTEDELEDIGEGYILELVRRSLLERDYIKGSFVNPVKREKYKMHDLVHDLAHHVAGNEFLTIKTPITEAIPETVRHVSFGLNTYCSFPRPLMEAKKLRTIVPKRTIVPTPSLKDPIYSECTVRSPVEPAIASFRSLRVLEGQLGLPESIGKLKLLRYISINECDHNLPNSLCMLLNLQYLDVSDSFVSRLPEDFCKLINLRFLALTTTLTRLPKEGIGRLTSLRTLFFYRCYNLETLGEGIEHLSSLRDLAIGSCFELVSLPAGLRHLTFLERLYIGDCEKLNLSEDDDLKGLRSLKKLELFLLRRLVNLPKGLLDAATTLTHLEIEFCENFTSPSEFVLPNLLSLQSLRIESCRKVVSLPEGMQRLTKLRDLRIDGCRLNTSNRYREGGEDWPKIAHVGDMNCSLSYVCSVLLLCVVELESSIWLPCAWCCVGSGVVGDGSENEKMLDVILALYSTGDEISNTFFIIFWCLGIHQTFSFVNAPTIIGRDDGKEKLVRLLLSPGNEENVAIIPIVGMGGLGKTILAQLVYNDDEIQERFTKRLWVYISNDFDVKRILIKLLQAGDTIGDSNEGPEQLQNRVRNLLRGHKFLLFLDDVWEEDHVEWEKLKDLLIMQARGSKIVVTTRSKKVALIVRTSTVKSYEFRGLSDDECLRILVKWAFKEGDESKHPNLVNITREIVKKCGGVPLAARTLGALLFSKTNEHDWSSVRDSEMWAIVQKENDILAILRLSYDQMPSYLKPCFQYCSLFEKDEDIYGRKLIYAWIALAYVRCLDPNEELEDIAEGYILELVRRSFLELNYSIFPIPVRRETYKMHDLVHDLAQYVAGNECLTVKGTIPEAIPDTIRHVSFGSNTYCTFPRPLMEAKKLRTIFYPVKIGPTLGSSIEPEIASFRRLRVLEGRDFDDSVSLP